MLKALSQTVENGARRQYANVMAKQGFDPHDVAAGRDYVADEY